MRYFAWHELIYQRLIAGGAATWDRTPYDEFELRPLVEKVLQQWLRPGERVLVLGCGTGPGACHFAEAGMRVTGIDISPTAIDLAKKQAADRGLDVTWIVGDACDLNRAGRFDAVLDAHMLHCLALAADRTALIRSVADTLVVGGRFIIATMIANEATTFPDRLELDDEGILWTKPSDDFVSMDSVEREGRRWIPTRYVLRDPSPLRDALATAGLSIEWQTIVPSGTEGDPAELQIVCRKTASPAAAVDQIWS
jgi:SAM-dependent methyltransferase